jgi:hypothetical protein
MNQASNFHTLNCIMITFVTLSNIVKRSLTAAPHSKAWTAFARSDVGIVGSNPTQDMMFGVCMLCFVVVLSEDTEELQHPLLPLDIIDNI